MRDRGKEKVKYMEREVIKKGLSAWEDRANESGAIKDGEEKQKEFRVRKVTRIGRLGLSKGGV